MTGAPDRGGPGRPPLGTTRGMTLLEVLLAVTILAVIVVLLTASLRVGLRAWEAGERQAAAQQQVRVVVELVTESLAAAYPYRGRLGGSLDRVVLFEGTPDEVRFVTTAPPLLLDAPDFPFHAVVLGRDRADRLRLEEKVVPAEDPFRDGATVVLSRSAAALRLRYRDAEGAWLDRWDGRTAGGLPTAVRVELELGDRKPGPAGPAFVVPLALGKTGT